MVRITEYIKTNKNIQWNDGLSGACYGNQKEVILLMLNNGATNLNWEFYKACSVNKKIISFLIEQVTNFSNNKIRSWNERLSGACRSGNKELTLLLIEKGANDFNNGLSTACYHEHKEIVELMISLGANNFNEGLLKCYYHQNKELALLMIKCGADINKYKSVVNFLDLYYLYQLGLPKDKFGIFKNSYKHCEDFHSCFYDIIYQLLSIEDLAKIVVSY
jgi:ankyrin repeat protein